ncbi:MAG TPA: hypothetical protein VI955_02160 [Candidatus Omnitrophota bacterium]|nr:hypothetical protein [Candidatus Omnitrophota bacterium]
MTRDEIYEHLAKVYLGKRENVSAAKKKKRANQPALVINIAITAVLVISTVYGFTAFLTDKAGEKHQVFYALNNDPVRIVYDLNDPFPAAKTFAIDVPVNASKYAFLNFSIRGMHNAYPGVVKLAVVNRRNERATYFVHNVNADWQKVHVPLKGLNLTDWTTVREVSFILEAWNTDFRKGTVLIDDIGFSN